MGTPLVFVDSLARSADGTLGDPTPAMPWIYQLAGVEPVLDSLSPVPFTFIGYFVTADLEHAPFLPVQSPLSAEEWAALLTSVVAPPGPEGSRRLRIQVWSARTETTSLTYFHVERQIQIAEPRSCTSHHLEGWLLPSSAEPRSVTPSVGNCDEKLEWYRRPLGLIVSGGRAVVAVAPYGWEGAAGMELWERMNGEVELVDFAPAM